VTLAGEGGNVLPALEGGQFDLLSPEIFSPGVDGLETMRHIPAPAVDGCLDAAKPGETDVSTGCRS
jgi:hypothetical protein